MRRGEGLCRGSRIIGFLDSYQGFFFKSRDIVGFGMDFFGAIFYAMGISKFLIGDKLSEKEREKDWERERGGKRGKEREKERERADPWSNNSTYICMYMYFEFHITTFPRIRSRYLWTQLNILCVDIHCYCFSRIVDMINQSMILLFVWLLLFRINKNNKC